MHRLAGMIRAGIDRGGLLRTIRSRLAWRSAVILGHDSLMAFTSMAVAYWLRYAIAGHGIPNVQTTFLYAGLFALLAFGVLSVLRIDRDLWRFASLRSLARLWRAVALTTGLFLLAAFMLTRTEDVPRSVPFIAAVLFMALVTTSRVLWRHQADDRGRRSSEGVPVLLVGVGPQADNFIRLMLRESDGPYRVEGLMSGAAARAGQRIQGIEVLGAPQDLPAAVAALRARGRPVQKIILTNDEPYDEAGPQLLEDCQRLGLSIARLPHRAELRDGLGSGADVRAVAIEDLLGRPQVRIDETRLAGLVRGRRVMVTGAGGSIGAELVRQIAEHGPGKLILLDQSEFNLYSIDRMMADAAPEVPRRAGLCDVRDRRRVAQWCTDEAPEIVFHAAALKHVPLVEDHAGEGVLTNAIGTRNVADAARACGAAAMVLISTDKAINPGNVMGATKRVAEAYCQALDVLSGAEGGTRYVTVRFGNVLGSAGSVVPLFQQQLARGGPLTVTHPEIKRYFMTIPEAVQLVLQASAAALRARTGIGQIFVLDMGKPIRIADLARQMIRLSGKRPDVDIRIDYVGLRPGEKLAEELSYIDEDLMPSDVPGVLLARPAVRDLSALRGFLKQLETAAGAFDDAACVELLREMLPEFVPAAEAAAEAARAERQPALPDPVPNRSAASAELRRAEARRGGPGAAIGTTIGAAARAVGG